MQFTGFLPRHGGTNPTLTHFTAERVAERLEVVRQAAGARFADLELGVLVQMVILTHDRLTAARQLVEERGWRISADDVLDSPFLLLGTVEQIGDQLRGYRERFGVSYLTVFDGRADGFDAVVHALAGT